MNNITGAKFAPVLSCQKCHCETSPQTGCGNPQRQRNAIILSHRRESMQRAAGTSRMVPDPQTGSDPTAAGGGNRKGSEWQWSARDEGVMPRTFAGYHNRKEGLLRCPVCALVMNTCVAHRPRLLVRVASPAAGSAPLTPPFRIPIIREIERQRGERWDSFRSV